MHFALTMVAVFWLLVIKANHEARLVLRHGGSKLATTAVATEATTTTALTTTTESYIPQIAYDPVISFKQITREDCLKLVEFSIQNQKPKALYLNSCGARFIKAELTYDYNVILYISMNNWPIRDSHTIIDAQDLFKNLDLNFAQMETVIRVDNCWTNQSKTVELEVAWSKGHRRLSMLVGSHYEYLWREFDVYSRPLEILTDDDCNVANSYVLLCANIDNVQCRVKIGTDFDVHCQSLAYIVNIRPVDDDNVGEYIFSGVASPDHAYHYQALFRIGCPTHQFDAENTVIDLELLGANHELEMQKIRFSAASMSRTRMDIYICNMYVLKPITSIQSVRAYLSGGNLDSAIFLFDIAIKLVDCPGPEDDEYNLQDKYFIPSKRVEENEIIYTQKLKIFAYIVSTPRVYYKLTNERNESSPLPPILYMFPTNGVLLIFVWLTSLFAILLVLYVLGLLYLKAHMLIVAIFVIIFSTVASCFVLIVLIYLYQELEIQNSFRELKACLGECRSKLPNCYAIAITIMFIGSITLAIVLVFTILRSINSGLLSWYSEAIILNVAILKAAFCYFYYNSRKEWLWSRKSQLLLEKRLLEMSAERVNSQHSATESSSLSNCSPAQLHLQASLYSPALPPSFKSVKQVLATNLHTSTSEMDFENLPG